jgi:hypothetical protein
MATIVNYAVGMLIVLAHLILVSVHSDREGATDG